jgi:hypothetical protein
MLESHDSNFGNQLIESNDDPRNLIQFLQNSDETNITETKIGKTQMPSKIKIYKNSKN